MRQRPLYMRAAGRRLLSFGVVLDWWAKDRVFHAPRRGDQTACGAALSPRWQGKPDHVPLRALVEVARPCRRCWTEVPL